MQESTSGELVIASAAAEYQRRSRELELSTCLHSLEAMLAEQSLVDFTDEAVAALSRLQKQVHSAKKLQDKFDTGGAEAEETHAHVMKAEGQLHSLILKHLYSAQLNAINTAFSKIRFGCLVSAALPTVLEPLAAFKFGDDVSALCKVRVCLL